MLPCRISAYEQDGKTILSTLKPTLMLKMFELPEAASIAEEVEASLIAIMDDASA